MPNARLRLRAPGRFPDIGPDHPVWAERPYKVFLYFTEEVWGCIEYVEENPKKEGLPRQHWEFVVPYNDWPLHKRGGVHP